MPRLVALGTDLAFTDDQQADKEPPSDVVLPESWKSEEQGLWNEVSKAVGTNDPWSLYHDEEV